MRKEGNDIAERTGIHSGVTTANMVADYTCHCKVTAPHVAEQCRILLLAKLQSQVVRRASKVTPYTG